MDGNRLQCCISPTSVSHYSTWNIYWVIMNKAMQCIHLFFMHIWYSEIIGMQSVVYGFVCTQTYNVIDKVPLTCYKIETYSICMSFARLTDSFQYKYTRIQYLLWCTGLDVGVCNLCTQCICPLLGEMQEPPLMLDIWSLRQSGILILFSVQYFFFTNSSHLINLCIELLSSHYMLVLSEHCMAVFVKALYMWHCYLGTVETILQFMMLAAL